MKSEAQDREFREVGGPRSGNSGSRNARGRDLPIGLGLIEVLASKVGLRRSSASASGIGYIGFPSSRALDLHFERPGFSTEGRRSKILGFSIVDRGR